MKIENTYLLLSVILFMIGNLFSVYLSENQNDMCSCITPSFEELVISIIFPVIAVIFFILAFIFFMKYLEGE